ncbi:MAG: transcription-repair coupling factor, partial [Candidatus Thermochlorobacter sp.]
GEASVMDFEREPSLTLSAVLAGERKIILTSPSELCRKVLSKEKATVRRMHLRRAETIGYEALQAFLQSNGFERKEFVEEEGDYAVRGSIIDVFSFGALKPVRIEFFGDEIESIRTFEVNTQLSNAEENDVELVANMIGSPEASVSLLAYLPAESLVVTAVFSDEEFGVSDSDYFSRQEIEEKLTTFTQVQLLELTKGDVHVDATPQTRFDSNFQLFAESLKKDVACGTQSVIATQSQKELDDIAEFLTAEPAGESGDALTLQTISLNLYEGFSCPNLSLYTESDI